MLKSSTLIAGMALLCALACAMPGMAQQAPAPPAAVDRAAMAAQVRDEFLHGWSNYERYAWGHDELVPLSRQPHDWYGQSLLMTPVDSLDTLILMGLHEQADKTRQLIDSQLSLEPVPNLPIARVVVEWLSGGRAWRSA